MHLEAIDFAAAVDQHLEGACPTEGRQPCRSLPANELVRDDCLPMLNDELHDHAV